MANAIPTYIKSLLRPNGSKPVGRKVWSVDLETVWLPFFTATNCEGQTAIPHEALGAPIRLGYNADGSVKFNERTGKPIQRVAQELGEAVKLVRENFTATLQQFSGQVANQHKDEYKEQVKMNREAGTPIVNRDGIALDSATEDRLLAFLEANQEPTPETPETAPESQELATVA